jgi:hypothetical protein
MQVQFHNENFQRLIRFDRIRISKLLEIIQDGIIVFVLSFYIGSAIDRFFQKADDSWSNQDLILSLLAQFTLLMVAIYYIRKVAEVIPFFFSLTKEYVSNKKGEVLTGYAVATAIIFVGVQKNFLSKIELLKQRFALN